MPIKLKPPSENLKTLELPGFGLLKITAVTMGAMEKAESAMRDAPEGERGKIFLYALVEAAAFEPKLSRDEINLFSDEILSVLTIAMVDQLGVQAEYEKTDNSLPVYDRLLSAWREYWGEIFEGVTRSVRSVFGEANSVLAQKYTSSLTQFAKTNLDLPRTQLLRLTHVAGAVGVANDAQRYVELLERSLPSDLITRLNETRDFLNHSVSNALDSSKVWENLSRQIQIDNSKIYEVSKSALDKQNKMDLVQGPFQASWLQQLQEVKDSTKYLLDQIKSISVPEPYISEILIASGVDSPRIHSSSYIFPSPRDLSSPDISDLARHRRISAFDVLDKLEHSMRGFIEEQLREKFGDEWWNKGIRKEVRIKCEERKLKKEKPSESQHPPITYAYIVELGSIILEGKNWNDTFQKYFRNAKETEIAFNRCNRVRPNIAHSRDLTDEEYKMFMLEAPRLLRLIGK